MVDPPRILEAISIAWPLIPPKPLASGDGRGLVTGGSLWEMWGFSLCSGHLGPKALCLLFELTQQMTLGNYY